MCSHCRAGDGAPQTFLLTPKLLSGLDFNDHIHVHDIFNGPQIDEISSVRVRTSEADGLQHAHLTAWFGPSIRCASVFSVG